MALHLVGETIAAKPAHARAQQGEWVQLVRGIYVDRADSPDAVVLRHAVRIAHYLYPQAYLSSVSSVRLAPTQDGRLFLAGRRNQRTRLRALEIVQNEAPAHPSVATAIVADDLGELRVAVSSPRQRFLEAFRLRSEHAAAIDLELRGQLAERLLAEFGSPKAAADALWQLARENEWYREGEKAERYLLTIEHTAAVETRNSAALDFDVAWHGRGIGTLHHDGFEWRWRAATAADLPLLVRETSPGRLPAFVESLLPEGWLENVLSERDERDTLRHGRRYMSNITIVPHGDANPIPADVLTTPLSKFTRAGHFTGQYAGPTRGELDSSFEQGLARLFVRDTPRLSGVQIKAPMSLRPDGSLMPAVGHAFTHILKPAGTSGFEKLPVVEWLCLELGRHAGFEVPSAALVAMPDGMAPALLIERFDVRRSSRDQRMWALEDFCSVLDVPAAAKYDATIERVGKALRGLSTDPIADLELLLRRAIFAWLIADGDMHLKNLALLKRARLGSRTFTSVRMSPLYDAVSTRVFPNLAHDRMALKLNGKDDRLTRADFRSAATTLGISVARADASCSELAEVLATQAPKLHLPVFARREAKTTRDAFVEIVERRAKALR